MPQNLCICTVLVCGERYSHLASITQPYNCRQQIHFRYHVRRIDGTYLNQQATLINKKTIPTYEYHKCLLCIILERQAFAIQLYFSIFPSFYCMITHAAGSSISANSDGNFQERPLSVRLARHASLSDRETSNQPQLYAMMMVIPTAHECNLLQTISISYQELKYSMMKENNKYRK